MSDNKQSGKWSNPVFLHSLVVGFYGELKNGSLPQEAKDRVEAKLRRDGFEDTTWDGIRQPGAGLSLSLPATSGSRYPSHSLLYTLRTHIVSPNVFL
ncbi:hypothetical protein CaCOL14_000863 [Colletotrichum acutatum]